MLREQSQMIVAAASQPVLVQVAQEAAVKDLMDRIGGMQETLQGKISEDTELQELMARAMERIQDDLGGPEALQQLMQSLGLAEMPNTGTAKPAYDDLPPGERQNPKESE
jgi:glucose-6-phosphate-specific signal transduction histidine kinase